ncbi:uncharacterized protein [Watersipora subatra]|uniref:uncharacterized protein isoform X2 n=1 Tax=Watersipora subatra TaxID=2589382 RepID=UPI00355B05E5
MPIGYRFDGFSGRLAFKPIEEMPITKMTPSERPAFVRTVANMSSPVEAPKIIPQTEIHGVFPDNAKYRKIQEWQRRLTRPDGREIHVKLPRDVTSYRAFSTLIAVTGVILCHRLYLFMYDKKP